MSTRGAVAWGNLEHWTGIYQHYDSYPSGLGQDVWDKIKEIGAGNLAEELQKHRSWDALLKGGQCPYCGQQATAGNVSGVLFAFDENLTVRKEGIESLGSFARQQFEEHTIIERWIDAQKNRRGALWNQEDWRDTPTGRHDFGYKRETENGLLVCYAYAATGFPDPHGLWHTHAAKEVGASRMTEKTSDKLFIEWVYIIDLEANMLHVLAHGNIDRVRPGLTVIGSRGNGEGKNEDYCHFHMASVPLSEQEFPHIADPYPPEDGEEDGE